jgi:predicted dehydrogenase
MRYTDSKRFRLGNVNSFIPATPESTESLQAMATHFIACALNGQRPITDGEAGLRIVRTLESIDKAIQPQQTIIPQSEKKEQISVQAWSAAKNPV